jgi:hypothetical protein
MPTVNGLRSMSNLYSYHTLEESELRGEWRIEKEDAALLMDHCTRNLTSDMMDLRSAARVQVVIFALHTTPIARSNPLRDLQTEEEALFSLRQSRDDSRFRI